MALASSSIYLCINKMAECESSGSWQVFPLLIFAFADRCFIIIVTFNFILLKDRRPTLSLADSSILFSGTSRKISPTETEAERTTEYWINKGQNILQNKLQQYNRKSVNDKRAKNIIMFLGDGMSVHTVTATRNFLKNSSAQVYLEKFPYLGFSKTYCVDAQVADSACTATAYLSGIKGNYGTIGVNAKVRRRHCKDGLNPENRVFGLAEWAQKAGMKTGVVSTARVTHASPAGIYAHTPERSWENDAAVAAAGCDPLENIDIARQLVEGKVGKRLNVILGGGRQNFRNTTVRDEEGYPGKREDGRDLIKDWLREHSKSSYVWSRKGLFDLEIGKTEYLLGLFSTSHCPYHGDRERQHLTKSDPSLSEMTNAAIRVLQQNNEKGFFLFIEGARIDMAHHEAKARKSLEDTAEMIRAVQVARELCSEEDTLIVVTSDHSHTMTINGYPVSK